MQEQSMAVDIYLDPITGDINLTNNNMRMTANIEESSRQQVTINLSMFKGEWFANILAGIPYIANDNNPDQLLGPNGKNLLDATIKEGITSRENITQLTTYSSTLDKVNRSLAVSFSAVTNSGEVISEEDLAINI